MLSRQKNVLKKGIISKKYSHGHNWSVSQSEIRQYMAVIVLVKIQKQHLSLWNYANVYKCDSAY